jgi:protoporphyrin/coproporphyrin ferrochelatase
MSRAVLLLAHGTPNVLGEMAEYLGKVTGGRPMPREVVEELQHRYAQIGLRNEPGAEPPPLTRWTEAQGHSLAKLLPETPVYIAMRNWHPYIADVVDAMRRDGVTSIRAICLAPQNSRTSVGLYRRALMSAAEGMQVDFIAGWADHPLLIDAFAEKLLPVWTAARREAQQPVAVLFTAHSVPCRTIMTGEASLVGARPGTPMQDTPDPYPVEAKRTAALVAGKLAPHGLREPDCYFAFQSQGVAGGPWIGPTVEDTLKALKAEGRTAVVIQPVGFVCDHVEVLYDIDIAFRELSDQLGLRLWRAESLNDSPLLARALAGIAQSPPQNSAPAAEHATPQTVR